ncbi:hypothetical protein BJX62DRAFT_232558 [Aspergillus germanicus]
MVAAPSSILALATSTLFSALARADDITMCTEPSCNAAAGNCPLILYTNDSPNCEIWQRAEFDGFGFETISSGGYAAYMNIPQPPSGCQYIVGTGGGCGAIVGRFNNAVCVRQPVTTSISLSKCCGDCDPDEKLVPANLTTRAVAPIVKRDCDTFTQTNGPYEIVGPSHKVSDTKFGPGHIDVSESVETSRTTSFSASIGDPFGIISESVGFEFTESHSQSLTYSFDLAEGQNGYVSWAPTMTCVDGTLSGCDGGAGDETGQACTPKENGDGDVVGTFSFVNTAKEVPAAKRSVRFAN